MKLKITKEEYEELSDDLKALYEVNDDGEYVAQIEDLPDTGPLLRAKQHEKERRQQAEKERKEVQDQLTALQDELNEMKDAGSRKKGDVEALENSYKDKIAKLEAKHEAAINDLNGVLRKHVVDGAAMKLATELSGENAAIMLPHIKSRISMEMEDGEAKVRILDTEGHPTGDTMDDLKNFFSTNDAFSSIVIGSKGSGGGAAGDKGAGGAGKKKLSEMTGLEEVEFAKENPEEYAKQAAERYAQPNA